MMLIENIEYREGCQVEIIIFFTLIGCLFNDPAHGNAIL